MTQAPVPFSLASAYDFLNNSAGYNASVSPPGRNEIRISRVQGEPLVLRWDLHIRDLSGGLDCMQVEIDGGYVPNKLADSTLDHRHSRTLILNPIMTAQASPDPGSPFGMFSCIVFNNVAIGCGQTANLSLFSLTSNIDPTVRVHTFTPNARITGVAPVHIGGVAADLRLAVLTESAAAEILSDLSVTPTSAGDMHVNTADCWWMYESPLNATTPGAGTLIFQANNNIYTLSTTAAIGTAPTSVLTQISDGGWGIGIVNLAVPRIYFVQPRIDTTTSMLGSAGIPGDIFSVNLEGTDPQRLNSPLPFVKFAAPWRNGIVATDGKSIVWHIGNQIIDLGWQRERNITANRQPFANNFGILNEQLFVLVVEIDTTASDAGNIRYWIEQYILEVQAWYQVSTIFTTGLDPEPSAGSLPIFRDTDTGKFNDNIMYWYNGAAWQYMRLTPPNWNPFYASRNTSNTSGFENVYALAGTALTPIYHFYEGFKKCVSDIWFGGQHLASANIDSNVEIEIASQAASSMSFTGNQSAVFYERDRWEKQVWSNPNPEVFDRLQMQVTITQGTGTGATSTTPNALPFKVGGYIFLDGEYKKPAALEPWRFKGR